jgi:replication factor C subunit 2/4
MTNIFDDLYDYENIKINDDTNSKTNVETRTLPWVEKYRPKRLDDIIEQDEVVNILKKTLHTGELPHLILHGSPGTGKTTTILAVAHQLFGPNKIEERVLELNASDDRGISIVRNKIISFSKIALGSIDSNYPSPPFKLIILDEADAMTSEAQSALRKIMETKSNITRFCFICNYSNQIIEPIKSRCSSFRFKPVNNTSILKRLKIIANNENLKITNDIINEITNLSDGDLRRAIMTLQNLKYILKYDKKITTTEIIKLTGGIDNNIIENIWNTCMNGTIQDVRMVTINICREGYQIKNVLNLIKNKLIECNLSDDKKSILALELCNVDKRLIESSDEYLQLLNILVLINTVKKQN